MNNPTTIHSIEDICMIYEGKWPVRFWNFTDQKYEYLKYKGIGVNGDCKPVVYFSTDGAEEMTTDILRRIVRNLPAEHKRAYVEVWNTKTHQNMYILFGGSTNKPVKDRYVHYQIYYMDPDFHKWKRDLYWLWFKIKYHTSKFFKQIFKATHKS